MTDREEVAASCPDFESLSCFADGELEDPAAAAVAAHVAGCSRCDSLAVRLREGFEADDARRDGGIGGSGCAGEERLVVYATGGLNGADRAAVAAHLESCDACIAALAVLHRRLSVADVVSTPVPADLQRRAQVALEAALREMAPVPQPSRVDVRGPVLLHRVRNLLRMPVLVPAALAAGALLVVGLQSGRIGQAGNTERTRALAPRAVSLRVTAIEATVRSRASMQSDVVATVRRGTPVEIVGEEREWYEVRLDGGRPGWVEREAFE